MNNNAYAKYIKIWPQTKDEAAFLNSPNSIVGDIFKLSFNIKNKSCLIKNKFNQNIGKIDDDYYAELILLHNKQFIFCPILTFVAFDNEEGGKHWGQFLVVAYNKQDSKEFSNFCSKISSRIAAGNRPDFQLNDYEYSKIISSKGAWQPKKLLPSAKLANKSAIVKNKQSFIEKLIEAARAKKPGCYIGSVIFLIVIIGGIAFLIIQLLKIN